MKRIHSFFKIALPVLFILVLPKTFAAGGVIHFTGAIVESPCEVAPDAQHLAVSCFRAGKNQVIQVNNQSQSNILPQDIGYVKTTTIQPGVKFMVINYN
ncbi:type 1 fimbrial protein [Lonsdalea quercina]|uniref:type 1 fimbrial protein n=1 Tax=Lonsdalea quercina TaxID=71657 RepID=UPI0006906FC4|nr:type 1 fimbrial protein [Lonsdalea quercina]